MAGGRDRQNPVPIRSAVVGLARRTPPVPGVIITERRMTAGNRLFLLCRLLFLGFSDAWPAEEKDL